MPDAPVLLDVAKNGVATITLNRPDAGNSIDLPTARALADATIRCQTDPAIRVVVLTGKGRMFSAGGDVKLMLSSGDRVPAVLAELIAAFHAGVSRLARMPKPVISLVNGPAAGGGFSLALVGDIVIAAKSAHFTAAYGAIGLTADGGLTWTLPRLVGVRKAQEIILTNRRIKSDEAVELGLITKVVEDDALVEAGKDLANWLADSAAGALGVARSLIWDGFESSFETQLDRELRSMVAASAGAEVREGLDAFLGKRPPKFRG
jgi:2-(1,2-epoxy-1,2-dihydrophenyl)acetyl-CoA isomerase